MGASQQLSAIALDQTGAPMAAPPGGAEVIWSSGDTTLVTIDEAGMIQGRRPGSTTIVARAGTLEGSVAATVVPAQLVVESGRSVSGVIGPEGGVLVAEGAGGIRYRLEIPAAAVMEETTITLTPVASFGNAPFMQLLGAARFAPDGLQLRNPAVLTIELTQTPPGGQIITGFTFSDDARELDLWLANVSGRTATMPIAHFSGAGVARVSDVIHYGRNAPFSEPLSDLVGRMLDVMVEHHQTGVWDLAELVDVFRSWYLQVVEPQLSGAVTDDDVWQAVASWRLWLSWMNLVSGESSGDANISAQLIEALGTEIDEARVLAAAALAQGIDWLNARCIAEANWVNALLVIGMQHAAGEFGLDEPGTGLDAETVQRELCVQVHNVDLIFPADPAPGEPAQLIVRTGMGYGGGPPVESELIRTWITPSGSTDDSVTSEESVEVIRQIVPTGEGNLRIDVRSCIAVQLPAYFSVQIDRVCAEDTIVRSFVDALDLNGQWNLVVDQICTGQVTVVHTGSQFTIDGAVGGDICPFSANGSGDGILDGFNITFGIGFGSGSDGSDFGVGTVSFDGAVMPAGDRMSGTYSTTIGMAGTWEATRQ
jgi:hypothetical protein